MQYNMEGELLAVYNSITEAAKLTNSLQPKITQCCKLQRNSHNNFQ